MGLKLDFKAKMGLLSTGIGLWICLSLITALAFTGYPDTSIQLGGWYGAVVLAFLYMNAIFNQAVAAVKGEDSWRKKILTKLNETLPRSSSGWLRF